MNDSFVQRIVSLSPKRLALLAMELQSQLDAVQQEHREPIAVIGMGCRFPGGADNPDAYWNLLQRGFDAITDPPEYRSSHDGLPATLPGANIPFRCGFLKRVDDFDAEFFGIAPREAMSIDPQQRLLLEVTWEAVEDAGLAADKLEGSRTGVFVGISGFDFARRFEGAHADSVEGYVAAGTSNSVAAGRLAYVLGLQGPCVAVDTACSSSLEALSLACDSIHNGSCDAAVAGGVNLILSGLPNLVLEKAGMLAPDSHCKTFDASADGFVRGEGCGMVVLKRISKAQKDGDRIIAVIRGTAVNHDGRSNGLTAPNGLAQESLLREALKNADLEPGDVQFVESHGSGTGLGDPIEAQALAAVFGVGRSKENPLLLGAVKTNLGHLEAAAGIAGFIKAVLAIEHGEIPPSLYPKTPNPHVNWEKLPLSIPTRRTPWPINQSQRIAGVSSFGFSGTNVHVILGSAPGLVHTVPSETQPIDRTQNLLCISAKNEVSLRQMAARYENFLAESHETKATDVCYTANIGRNHFPYRLSVVGDSNEQLRRRLANYTARTADPGIQTGHAGQDQGNPVVFLFTGQGSQYSQMGRELYESRGVFRDTLDRCSEILREPLGRPLQEIIYPKSSESEKTSLIDQTAYTQPALFALEYSLAEQIRSWGIQPAASLGHSVGEYVAACVAGVFSLEDGLKLIAERARLMQSLPPGGTMAAVFADESCVARVMAPFSRTVSIAALNGPANTVISGVAEKVSQVCRKLEAEGVAVQELTVSHAFHSQLLDPILDEFEQAASRVAFARPQRNVISNLSGKLSQGDELSSPGYWRQHARQAVRFQTGMETLHSQGHRLFLEIGPNPVLTGMARRIHPGSECRWIPTLRRNKGDWQQLLEALASLYVQGASVNWSEFDKPYRRQKVSLPTYAFDRKRYWPETARSKRQSVSTLGMEWQELLYELRWRPRYSEDQVDVANDAAASVVTSGDQSAQDRSETIEADKNGSESVSALKGRWLVFASEDQQATRLVSRLTQSGGQCVVVRRGTAFELKNGEYFINEHEPEQYLQVIDAFFESGTEKLKGILYLWPLDAGLKDNCELSEIKLAIRQACGSLLLLVQALASSTKGKVAPLTLVSRGAQNVANGRDIPQLAQTTLWGMAHSIALEQPELQCVRLDLDPRSVSDQSFEILTEITRDARDDDQIAFRDGKRFVLRLAPIDHRSLGQSQFPIRRNASYLITGGLSGLGLLAARWLVERGARTLVLAGRQGPSPEAQDAIAALTSLGARIETVQADVSRALEVSQILSTIDRLGSPLRGVIHSAGTVDVDVLTNQSWDRFEKVMSTKVDGSWNLHQLTRKIPLDFCVYYSSESSMIGAVGQSNYAAANAFLDGLAPYRRAHGLPALSMNWAPWSGVGLAAQGNTQERYRKMGIQCIDPRQGMLALESVLAADAVQAAVLPINWQDLSSLRTRGTSRRRLFEELVEPTEADPVQASAINDSELKQLILAAAPAARQQLLLDAFMRHALRVLGFDSDRNIDAKQPLRELGLDSVMAIELRNAISKLTGLSVPATALFNYPSLHEIADYVADLLNTQLGIKTSTVIDDNKTVRPGEDDLNNLSEEELERMLEASILSL